MDYEALKFWFSAIQAVITGGLWIYVWNVNRNRVTNERISNLENEVDTRLDDHGQRLATLESDVSHLPSHDDLGQVHEKVNAIATTMGEIKGELTALNRNFRLLFEDRLNQGSRR